MDADGPSMKLRKPYTITKIRDRWTEEEHDRFLEALLLYGRDWKKVEGFIGTKTVIQIRSHAQKYFLKVQKKGMMAHVPPPRPKHKAAYPCAQKDKIPLLASKVCSPTSTCLIPASTIRGDTSMAINCSSIEARPSTNYISGFPGLGGDNGLVYNPSGSWSGNSSKSCVDSEVPKHGNPHSLRSVTLNMAEIYRFIGNMVDPVVRYPLGIYLQKLKEMDPIVVKLVLRMMKNLTNNLSSPHFEMLRNLLMADRNYRIIKATAEATAPAELIENVTMAPYVGLLPPC